MSTNPRPLRLREARFSAQHGIRRRYPIAIGRAVIRAPAGGQLMQRHIRRWLNPPPGDTLEGCEAVVDVYLEQVCHTINRRRNVVKPNGRTRPGNMRVMLSQPHPFYLAIAPLGGEQQGSTMLRGANVIQAEFRQLEYFFVPIILRGHACLVAISPLHHTVELVDSAPREVRAICRIFNIIVRFLIHELGTLPGPRWRFLHSKGPSQAGLVTCGNFTCLAAKALAGGLPLDEDTDLGQGSTVATEAEMRFRVIDDLFHQGGWSDIIMPLGGETILQRHDPGGSSELQCAVFLNLQGYFQVQPGDRITQNIVSLLRANISVPSLVAWCRSRGFALDPNGNFILKMRGYQQWALMSWSDFLIQIESHL